MVPAGPGKYRALLGSIAITRPTRQPRLDGARALLALGYAPETAITARHAGSDTIAMRSTVGEAACRRETVRLCGHERHDFAHGIGRGRRLDLVRQ